MVRNEKEILDLLKQELVTALGCTEPAAIAYAGALAVKQLAKRDIQSLKVSASGNVIKNAMSVYIPGTQLCGVGLAAALGAVAGDADKQLEALAGLREEDVQKAQTMIAEGKVTVLAADTDKKLWIEVVAYGEDSSARVILADQHTCVVKIEVDGKDRTPAGAVTEGEGSAKKAAPELTVADMWEFATTIELDKLELVQDSIILNRAAAVAGLEGEYGLQVGKTILANVKKGLLGDDLVSRATAWTAAGSDARMGGCTLPVMSNSGSGNQGLTATLPVVAVGEKLGLSDEKILRGTALSHLITILIKGQFGRLSALCGATVAGTGAACGVTYLLGGGLKEVSCAIQNMMGNVAGMLCDGAKAGCAMKVATCIQGAVQSALLAMDGHCIEATNGIIELNAEGSITNLCRLGNEGTKEADRIILDIMLNKKLD